MLRRITGHKSVKMLERYYAFNPTDLVKIVDEYNPLESIGKNSFSIKTNGSGGTRTKLRKRT